MPAENGTHTPASQQMTYNQALLMYRYALSSFTVGHLHSRTWLGARLVWPERMMDGMFNIHSSFTCKVQFMRESVFLRDSKQRIERNQTK